MMKFAPWAFAGWTLFVWGGRLRNIFADPAGVGSVGWWTLTGALLFSAFGAILLGALILARGGLYQAMVAWVVAPLAILTTGTWIVRGVDIASGDHPFGFIAVHLVLAVVSVTLAALSLRVVGGIGTRR